MRLADLGGMLLVTLLAVSLSPHHAAGKPPVDLSSSLALPLGLPHVLVCALEHDDPDPDGAQWLWTPAGTANASILFVGTWSSAGIRVQGGVRVHRPGIVLSLRNFSIIFEKYWDEYSGRYDCSFTWRGRQRPWRVSYRLGGRKPDPQSPGHPPTTDRDRGRPEGTAAADSETGERSDVGASSPTCVGNFFVAFVCTAALLATVSLLACGTRAFIVGRRGNRDSRKNRSHAKGAEEAIQSLYETKHLEPIYVDLQPSRYAAPEYSSIRYGPETHT